MDIGLFDDDLLDLLLFLDDKVNVLFDCFGDFVGLRDDERDNFGIDERIDERVDLYII